MRTVSRSEWGARPVSGLTPIAGPIKGVAIHHGASATPTNHGDCAAIVRAYQNLHMDTHGWSDIAYNHLVCPHGYVYVGRGFGKRSAAQGTDAGNDQYHAICFIGTGDPLPPAAGLSGLRDIIAAYQNKYPGATDVRPHSDFHSTACPGNALRNWVKQGLWKTRKIIGYRVSYIGRDGKRDEVETKSPVLWLTRHPKVKKRGMIAISRRFSS